MRNQENTKKREEILSQTIALTYTHVHIHSLTLIHTLSYTLMHIPAMEEGEVELCLENIVMR